MGLKSIVVGHLNEMCERERPMTYKQCLSDQVRAINAIWDQDISLSSP